MIHVQKRKLVLAIAPVSKGFGYAVFEDGLYPIDWGIKNVPKPTNKNSLEQVRIMLHIFHPDAVVLEDYSGNGSRRSKRVKRLIDQIARLAENKQIKTPRYSRGQIQSLFKAYNAKTKHQIANVIAGRFPEFAQYMPPKRKLWESEHYNMALFDALSLGFAYYGLEA